MKLVLKIIHLTGLLYFYLLNLTMVLVGHCNDSGLDGGAAFDLVLTRSLALVLRMCPREAMMDAERP